MKELKMSSGHLLVMANLPHTLSPSILKLKHKSKLKYLYIYGQNDLDCQLDDLEMSIGHPLVLDNFHDKYEDSRSQISLHI